MSNRVVWYSYPQVYPQKDVTDYIIRQGLSGAKWRIVEYRTFLRGAS
jgi:hypothetical protein